MNVFSDPAKLLPVVGYIGIFVLLGLGKIDFNEAIVLFGVCGAGHDLLSSVNNTPKS